MCAPSSSHVEEDSQPADESTEGNPESNAHRLGFQAERRLQRTESMPGADIARRIEPDELGAPIEDCRNRAGTTGWPPLVVRRTSCGTDGALMMHPACTLAYEV